MQLTYEQKLNTGFQYILDRLNPSSPFGQERVRKLTPYTRDEQDQLFLELDNLERLIAGRDTLRPYFMQLKSIFMQMRDIRPTLKKVREMCLNDIELFELKQFLIFSGQADAVCLKIKEISGIRELDYQPTSGALDILDPDGRKIPSFSIADSCSPRLADIRQRKREQERLMEHAQTREERKDAAAIRRLIVTEEEEEEQRVREEMTDQLRPWIDAIRYNTEITGRMDLLMEKVSASFFAETAKPRIAHGELVLEDATNPWVAAMLKEKNLSFTPLSISLPKGASVITGANMGGKSVALGTVTLNVLLALSGFYIYAKKGDIPFFDNVLIISEEQQSARQGLSSFGAEIVQMKKAVDHIEREFCFVVLDEFSRGTNPQEGTALVRAVTRYLNEKNDIALLVTHFDHAAEYARVHYQAAGLKDMDTEQVKNEILAAGEENGVSVIASHMNYGLYRTDQFADCPKDAFRICRLLGLQKEILDLIEE